MVTMDTRWQHGLQTRWQPQLLITLIMTSPLLCHQERCSGKRGQGGQESC